jgi:hypothetical protein
VHEPQAASNNQIGIEMRNVIIVLAVYFVPAASLLIFAWGMDKWISHSFKKDAAKRRVGLTNR